MYIYVSCPSIPHFKLFLKECEWRYNREHYELETELKKLLSDYVKWQKKGTA